MGQTLEQRAMHLIQQAIDDGTEYGVQVAAYHRGQCILDISAGLSDTQSRTPVTPETVFPVFSATKGIAAAAVHLLAERGKLGYGQPMADLWPQFARNGKEAITIGQVLWHTAGLARLPADLTGEQITDWAFMADLLCGMTPQFQPGTHMEYHAMTYGWLLGEIVQRAEGRSMQQMIAQDIAAPLGIRDLFLSIEPANEALHRRVAVLYEPDAVAGKGREPASIPPAAQPLSAWMNRHLARGAFQPAISGMMSAHTIARFYASVLPGGVGGLELLPAQRVHHATCPPVGVVPDGPRPMAMGFRTFPEIYSGDPPPFGHAGYGGSLGLAIPALGLAFGFAHNLFTASGEELRSGLLRLVVDFTSGFYG